ncbi:hypothetical protein PENSPDRAFT_671229 [Peniophora sp. CONT]|nr:hypothetical protein PENSPDRAFT_671229 [Peniophora sp. CONT]
MSSLASSSDLSKQHPNSASSSGKLVNYGWNAIAGDRVLTDFIRDKSEQQLETFRNLSPVLRHLPFKSNLLDAPIPLARALYEQYRSDFAEGSVDYDFLDCCDGMACIGLDVTEGAQNTDAWEKSLFCNAGQNPRGQATMVRKLHLAIGEQPLHEPLALAQQAEYFGKQQRDQLSRWISVFSPFLAFDFVAAHMIPRSVTRSLSTAEALPYQQQPLDARTVKRFNTLFEKYHLKIAAWIEAMTSGRPDNAGHHGLLDMVHYASKSSIESSAALLLRAHLRAQDHPTPENELVLESLSQRIREDAKTKGRPLPDGFFTDDAENTDCSVPFLCSTMVSPVGLFMGLQMYGSTSALTAHEPFQASIFWQQLAHLPRPAWLKGLEDDIKQVMVIMAVAPDNFDGWGLLTVLAKRWKALHARNGPTDADVDFFKNRLIARETKNQKKKNKRTLRLQEGVSVLDDVRSEATKTADAGGALQHVPLHSGIPAPAPSAGSGIAPAPPADPATHALSLSGPHSATVQPTASTVDVEMQHAYNDNGTQDQPAASTIDVEMQPVYDDEEPSQECWINPADRTTGHIPSRSATPDPETRSASPPAHQDEEARSRSSTPEYPGASSQRPSLEQNASAGKGKTDDEDEDSGQDGDENGERKQTATGKRKRDDNDIDEEEETSSEQGGNRSTPAKSSASKTMPSDADDEGDEESSEGKDNEKRERPAKRNAKRAMQNIDNDDEEEEPSEDDAPSGGRNKKTARGHASSVEPLKRKTANKLEPKHRYAARSKPERTSFSQPVASSSSQPPERDIFRPASPPIKIEEKVYTVPDVAALKTIKDSWNSLGWQEMKVESDSESDGIQEVDGPLRTTNAVHDKKKGKAVLKKGKAMLDWARSIVVRATGRRTNTPFSPAALQAVVQGQTDGSQATTAPSGDTREKLNGDVRMQHASAGVDDGELGGDGHTDEDADERTSSASHDSELDGEGETDEEAAERTKSAAREAKLRREAKTRRIRAEKLAMEDNPDAESDCWNWAESDVEQELPDDGIDFELPLKPVDNQDNLSPMLLYDVRVALPRTNRNYGRSLFKTIDHDTRALLGTKTDVEWVETYSLKEWNDRSLDKIEASMHLGHVMLIRDSGVNGDYAWDMRSATKIKSGANPLECQDYCDPNQPSGLRHSMEPLTALMNPTPDRILNCLNAPQQTPLVKIPRQDELDTGSLAYNTRFEKVSRDVGEDELKFDGGFATGLNWAIISQKHAVSYGHVDTAGVYTAIAILTGIKYWAIRKTALQGKTEIDVDVADYFVDLTDRDFESLPGGDSAWVTLVLFPGDILIIPPNARHVVFTITNAMMSGIHFYNHTQFQRSVCGWITAKFASNWISNAEHDNFVSILQSHSTLWEKGFKKNHSLPEFSPILRTLPNPATEHGARTIVSLAAVIVFNSSLSGSFDVYEGLYWHTDKISLKKMLNEIAKLGYFKAVSPNLSCRGYKYYLSQWMDEGDVWDDRWTCLGLGEVFAHVGRALVFLSYRWAGRDLPAGRKPPAIANPREDPNYYDLNKKDRLALDQEYCLSPEQVHLRVLKDISSALGFPVDVVEDLIGSLDEIIDDFKKIKTMDRKIFPDVEWVSESPRTSARRPSLWDAFYTRAPVVKDEQDTVEAMDVGVEGQAEVDVEVEEDKEQEESGSEYSRGSKNGKGTSKVGVTRKTNAKGKETCTKNLRTTHVIVEMIGDPSRGGIVGCEEALTTTTMSTATANSPPVFPLPCHDIRRVSYLVDPHYVLVLQGSSSPANRPLFSQGEILSDAVVDDQGRWGVHEWSSLPQLYDPSSPWLPLIPIYHDAHHITRSTIHRTMMVHKERQQGKQETKKPEKVNNGEKKDEARFQGREPVLFTAEPGLKERMKDYVEAVVGRARDSLDAIQKLPDIDGVEHIVWPGEAQERATYLSRLIIVGVPSRNSFKRAFTSMRRAILELEGFHVWATLTQAKTAHRMQLAVSLARDMNATYRGVFLHGDVRDWLDAGSDVRRIYAGLMQCYVPTYVLVREAEWNMAPLCGLRHGIMPFSPGQRIQDSQEEQQLRFYCYPPHVASTLFERAARGLSEHSAQGQQGAVDHLGILNGRRFETQVQQMHARTGDPYTGAVGEGKNKRPDPQWQAFLNSSPPPTFMTSFDMSDLLKSSIGPYDLAHDVGKGLFLPRPALIWGLNGNRRMVMLETLATVWKLLVLRSCLFRRGDLSSQDAHLSNQDWRSILNRTGSDTALSAMWRVGKPELWGARLLPDVVQRIQTMSGQPTLKRMDCSLHCLPIGKFSNEHDPQRKLEHVVLFRLAELHVLHDFASYHPDLQHRVDGRWCPPPFDAQDALDDRLNAFPGLSAETSAEEHQAMEDILAVVRWNGRDGVRAWEMEDGPSYREWLTAFRTLLSRCPTAWTNNRIFDSAATAHPELDILNCDLSKPDAAMKTIRWVLMGTHMMLSMRAGRVPSRWFDKPELTDLSLCNHDRGY